eukprot:Tamp_35251.p2 GENE.Tamp_35251~~Tamp_35251.p2  ORF type:complete len:114 (-),score=6.59 Tamp_35251:130-471(-)
MDCTIFLRRWVRSSHVLGSRSTGDTAFKATTFEARAINHATDKREKKWIEDHKHLFNAASNPYTITTDKWHPTYFFKYLQWHPSKWRRPHLISLFAESDNCGAPTTQPARLRA